MNQEPRYPIGRFKASETYSLSERNAFIDRIESLPERLQASVNGLTTSQLNTPYRDGGWTVRQVVHHIADSHTNAYVRMKWTLTEESPVIKAYDEKIWATTPETKADPNLSLVFIKALHAKWVTLLRALDSETVKRHFVHPETKRSVRIEQLIAMYAWHGDHHLAHIQELKRQKNW